MKISQLIAGSLIAALAIPATLHVVVTLNPDQASFIASNPIVLTNTFDVPPAPTIFPVELQSVTIDDITYTHSDANPGWRIAPPPSLPPSPPNALFPAFEIGDVNITFDGEVTAIGFHLGVFVSPTEFRLHVTEAGGAVTEFPFSNPHIIYNGFSSNLGITSVAITQIGSSGVFSNFSIDNVSRSQIVPEPSAVFALAMGCLTLPRTMRTRRNGR